ncbi:hypothetical protein CAEBREN_31051 [Caenorhabditis brenneri]|uniref:Phospholipid/glycerol acyltransferase domain-containing protein n=1 Tax=Caenorhabditis brenneri TaxID=135651 RepID=G0MHR7_CAEBE|nr:hypothetical protein CAEBREN_31051 [Caenorhabditis brenneri]
MILLLFWFLILLLIFLAVTGKTLGLRELYVNTLIRIFEWGATLNAEYEEEEASVSEDEDEPGLHHVKMRRSSSSSDLGIINREKSEIIDAKLHETNVPQSKQTTVSVLVDDTLDFITAGMEAVIEDQVTNRFSAAQLPSWNLLSRTKYSFHFFNWQLTLLWIAGFMFRYYVLVPCRIALFAIAIILMIISTSIIGMIPNAKVRKFLNRKCMLMCMRIYSRAFSSVIRFHDRENRANKGGICVANHTSPIDVMVLSCDNCYAMIGQKQGGFLGFLQNTLSRSEHHIWFERGEAGDRKQVMNRMREHVEDENKLPIIIFPEGTCINNTSVMMFKKGSFEIGSTIYPIAVKYDTRLTDAFWNSSAQSYGRYLWSMMTSWAIICDVWYLPPMTRGDGEDSIAFAKRVKRAIAKKGGLIDLEWDGALKRERVSSKLVTLQQKLYFERLTRTTTLNSMLEEKTSDILSIMQDITEEERNELLKQIDEQDDEDEMIRKISSMKPKFKLGENENGEPQHIKSD